MVAEEEGGSPAAVVVTGAGYDAANGLYTDTGKRAHGAPVYENDQRCLLSREPHMSRKTGRDVYGWILGQDRRALYIMQCESLTPPADGWRPHSGIEPAPCTQSLGSLEEGAQVAGKAWKELGNHFFAAWRYDEAVAKWTRGLGFVAGLEGSALRVALYSNRAEARLRQRDWTSALSDAQAAVKLRPTHDKALLRAAVAAKELKRLDLAYGFVMRCLEAHPGNPEGEDLLMQLEERIGEEHQKNSLPARAKSARRKLQDSLRNEAAAEDVSRLPKAFAAKDTNSRKGFKAFEGYSEKRSKREYPPVHELPYHQMGLPQEEVDLMDKFFTEMRRKNDERLRKEEEDKQAYEALKRECKQQAEEMARAGQAEKPPQEIPPTRAEPEKPPEETPEVKPEVRRRQRTVRAVLAEDDKRKIDALFAELAAETLLEQAEAVPEQTPAASSRRERLDASKPLVTSSGDIVGVDRRSARERQLDEEEANERRQRDLRVRSELERLKATRKGEPTRLEQAGGEVYCWWSLPAEVGGREVKVKTKTGGTWLTVTVRGVAIFDGALFGQVRSDDVVWSVDEGELHVTLTKAARNKLWEQLGDVPPVEKDERGEVLEESLPEPLSASDRLEKFQQMVTGDDGVEFNYDDLDEDARRLVDTIRRYRHAMATGDNNALSLAECDLQEFGKMVI